MYELLMPSEAYGLKPAISSVAFKSGFALTQRDMTKRFSAAEMAVGPAIFALPANLSLLYW
jgi:hypothetical protein